MDIIRALRFPFDDPHWVQKLTIIAALTAASLLLMPFFLLGLLPLSILLGYMLEVVNNVRDGRGPALPVWNQYDTFFTRGGGVLLGLFFYNLPLLLLLGCGLLLPSITGDSLVNGAAAVLVICCVLPLTLIYIAIAWPLMAVGVIRYARGRPTSIFFQTGRLWGTASVMGTETAAWLLGSIILNIIFSFLLFIPCIGWMVYAALLIPAQAHLIGQFARRIDLFEHPRPLSRPAPGR